MCWSHTTILSWEIRHFWRKFTGTTWLLMKGIGWRIMRVFLHGLLSQGMIALASSNVLICTIYINSIFILLLNISDAPKRGWTIDLKDHCHFGERRCHFVQRPLTWLCLSYEFSFTDFSILNYGMTCGMAVYLWTCFFLHAFQAEILYLFKSCLLEILHLWKPNFSFAAM